MSEPMTEEAGLRMMQRTEEARGCHHLAQTLHAGADALAKLSDPAYRLVKVDDLEEGLSEARRAGISQGLNHSKVVADGFWNGARALVGLSEEEG